MSLSDSDDDIEPGSSADWLLRRMGRRPHGDSTLSHRNRKEPNDPTSLEAQILGAGVTSPFNTWHLEETLRQQAAVAMDRRQHEIEAFESALHDALAELQRVRAAEESRLAARVAESTRRFHHQLEALQQQYLAEVERLKRQTVAELHKQRAQSEAAIAARVRALQGELRHERPAGLLGAAGATAGLASRPRASSPGPGLGTGTLYTGTSTRLRSASAARPGALGAGSPAPAASPGPRPGTAGPSSRRKEREGYW